MRTRVVVWVDENNLSELYDNLGAFRDSDNLPVWWFVDESNDD